MDDDQPTRDNQFSTFQKSQAFLDTLSSFLSVDLTVDPSPEQEAVEEKQFLLLRDIVRAQLLGTHSMAALSSFKAR